MAREEDSGGWNSFREATGAANPKAGNSRQSDRVFIPEEAAETLLRAGAAGMRVRETSPSSTSDSATSEDEFLERNRGGEDISQQETEMGSVHTAGSSQSGGVSRIRIRVPSPVFPSLGKKLITRLQEFLEMYENAAAGVECEKTVETMVGAALMKKMAKALEENVVADTEHTEAATAENALNQKITISGTEVSSAPHQETEHPTKERADSSGCGRFVIAQSDVERIELEAREQKLQEQERALKIAAQLNQAFVAWQKNAKGTGSMASSNGDHEKEAEHAHNDAAPEPGSIFGSRDAVDNMMTLCQFLVNFETERLEGDSIQRLSDMLLPNSGFDQQMEDVEAILTPNGHDWEMYPKQRSRSIKNTTEDVACYVSGSIETNSKQQQKLKYLLDFRGKLGEREWRVGVDLDLVLTYFKVLLEFLVNQTAVTTSHLTDVEGQLEKSRGELDSLRGENTVLSRFVDQLTEEIESCQGEILNCRDALKDASQRSAQSKAEFHELHGRTDVLRGELEGRLEKEVAEVKRLTRELEGRRWQDDAETSIYLQIVDDMELEWSQMTSHLRAEASKRRELEARLEREAAEVKRLTRELEGMRWQDDAESSIYLQVVDEMELGWSQMTSQLRAEASKRGELEGRLEKERAEANKMAKELEGRLEKKVVGADKVKKELEDNLDKEAAEAQKMRKELEGKLEKEVAGERAEELEGRLEKGVAEAQKRVKEVEIRLEKEVAEVEKMAKEAEGTRWEHDVESSIYLEVFEDMARKWSQEIRDLTAELKEGAIKCELEKKDAEVKKLVEELEQTILEHEAESSIYLEVVNQRAREWALRIDNVIVDFSRKEGALEGLLEEKDVKIKKLAEELELTMWEHEAETSIYLEVVGERDREWAHTSDNSAANYSNKQMDIGEQVVRRKELQASCSFSGRTQKESLAYEDSSPLLQGGLEGLKAALKRPSPLKGLSPLGDQSAVSSPGKSTDPIFVVVRRNTQAAVEGFMVDIGESPSKKANKEVVSSLRMEVMELRREKEHLLEQHTGELHELKCEYMKEAERIKAELEQKCQIEMALLEEEVRSCKQQLEQAMQEKEESSQSSYEDVDRRLPESETEDNCGETSVAGPLETEGSRDESQLMQVATREAELAAEQDKLRDRVAELELQLDELQEKVTKLEGERSWLEERVPGLEKKLATEQSRLEDTVAGHAFERDQLRLIVSSHKTEQTRLENEVVDLKTERNYLATAIATLGLEWRNLKLSNENERERWRSAYVMALKDMERALSRTQKQVKEERAQKGTAESDAQRMKVEIFTMQQETKDVWRLLERVIAENIGRAVGASQQVEYRLCQKVHQQTLRFEALQSQVKHLLQVFRLSQMSETGYLHTVENLFRAEQEVDYLGDEVDSLVALLEKVYTVLDQYAPVLLHYPGVAEVAKLVELELGQRAMQLDLPPTS